MIDSQLDFFRIRKFFRTTGFFRIRCFFRIRDFFRIRKSGWVGRSVGRSFPSGLIAPASGSPVPWIFARYQATGSVSRLPATGPVSFRSARLIRKVDPVPFLI